MKDKKCREALMALANMLEKQHKVSWDEVCFIEDILKRK